MFKDEGLHENRETAEEIRKVSMRREKRFLLYYEKKFVSVAVFP